MQNEYWVAVFDKDSKEELYGFEYDGIVLSDNTIECAGKKFKICRFSSCRRFNLPVIIAIEV